MQMWCKEKARQSRRARESNTHTHACCCGRDRAKKKTDTTQLLLLALAALGRRLLDQVRRRALAAVHAVKVRGHEDAGAALRALLAQALHLARVVDLLCKLWHVFVWVRRRRAHKRRQDREPPACAVTHTQHNTQTL